MTPSHLELSQVAVGTLVDVDHAYGAVERLATLGLDLRVTIDRLLGQGGPHVVVGNDPREPRLVVPRAERAAVGMMIDRVIGTDHHHTAGRRIHAEVPRCRCPHRSRTHHHRVDHTVDASCP